ncbi:MAG: LysR substrate-binding domain-containing protein [Pseudomonadota bacterium]
MPLPEARLLHADAELAILAFERFASRAKSIEDGADGLVRVGAIGSPAFSLMPDVMARFASIRGKVEVQLQVRSSPQIAYLVGNGQVDIGIVEAPVAAQGVTPIPVSIPCVCIMRADDPLAEVDVVRPEHLADRRMISVGENHPLDRGVREAFVSSGIAWSSDICCYFFSIIRSLVAKGTGVAIVDVINGTAALNDGVIWRPFAPALTYDLAVITRAGATFRTPTQDFLDMTVSSLEDFAARTWGDEASTAAT